MKDYDYDKLLNIKTTGGQKDSKHTIHYHPYEPTPYSALEELVKHYDVRSSDHIVDFGCGKGRLIFFNHYFYNASVAGVEMNEVFYREAVENLKQYLLKTKKDKNKIQFHCGLAEDYKIRSLDNRFYFFNPFSVHIFKKVVSNIMVSIECSWREVEIVLYYPSEDYIFFLENQTAFRLEKEIILSDLYEKNANERFLIYKFGT